MALRLLFNTISSGRVDQREEGSPSRVKFKNGKKINFFT